MTEATVSLAPAAHIHGLSSQVTTRFGKFAVEPPGVIQFAEGLPGFEQNRGFVLLSSRNLVPLRVLHAVDGPPVSFLAVDPRQVLAGYRTTLTTGDRLKLGADAETPLLWLALVTPHGDGDASVNLRAPVVVNPARMIGSQVMPHNSLYPLRHPLGQD
jgi:flagellar assembly factor FliW